MAIKTAWFWHKNGHENQWNRIENSGMNSCSCTHLIFDKGAQNIRWRKKTASSINVAGKSGCLPAEN
jgi:hypothetical protein